MKTGISNTKPPCRGAFLLLYFAFLLFMSPGTSFAQETIGKSSGLPVPRYVSLKVDRVNLREGPSREHKVIWVFQRPGLPVEITAEFDVWRRIRDSEGTEGWVEHALLSARRTALVAPWVKANDKSAVFPMFSAAEERSNVMASLQAGVIASVKACQHHWCHIYGDGFDGYIQQTKLWGVYPNEEIND